MKFFDRLYYPLSKAAEILGCDENDFIHLAAWRGLELCVHYYAEEGVYIDCYYEFKNEDLSKKIKKNCDSEISMGYNSFPLTRTLFIISCSLSENKDLVEDYNPNVKLKNLRGLLYVDDKYIMRNEIKLMNGGSFDVEVLSFPQMLPEVDNAFKASMGNYDAEIKLPNPFTINKENLLIPFYELDKLKKKGFPFMTHEFDLDAISDDAIKINELSPVTLAKVSRLVRALVAMIPSLHDLDIDTISSAKLKAILEAEAAQHKVDLPELHHQTYAKYFGIESRK